MAEFVTKFSVEGVCINSVGSEKGNGGGKEHVVEPYGTNTEV